MDISFLMSTEELKNFISENIKKYIRLMFAMTKSNGNSIPNNTK